MDRKISGFRNYLADSELVLAIVKCNRSLTYVLDLIALRSCPVLPEDPNQHLLDYFGNQRSPLWDQMETMTDENQTMAEELPAIEQ
jgi:hypothetical protein